jgi:hypothetical protein
MLAPIKTTTVLRVKGKILDQTVPFNEGIKSGERKKKKTF